MTTAVVDDVARRLGPRARRDEPLGPYTTYRVGGPAAVFLRVEDAEELTAVAAVVADTGVPVLVVGRGSNLLVSDRGFPGLALVLGEGFTGVVIEGTRVRAGAAESMPVVARRTVRQGLTGFEWAVGVPGSIGGAVRMNAGGHGSDLAASLVAVDLVDLHDGVRRTVPAGELGLGYRRSSLSAHDVVVVAELALAEGDRATAEETLSEIVRWRRANQPGGANAGSVFTNPAGDHAGRLIEAAGLKGHRVGTAAVSDKHANFIQAEEGGSADDVRRLMDLVRSRVLDQAGIELVAETRMVGFE